MLKKIFNEKLEALKIEPKKLEIKKLLLSMDFTQRDNNLFILNFLPYNLIFKVEFIDFNKVAIKYDFKDENDKWFNNDDNSFYDDFISKIDIENFKHEIVTRFNDLLENFKG